MRETGKRKKNSGPTGGSPSSWRSSGGQVKKKEGSQDTLYHASQIWDQQGRTKEAFDRALTSVSVTPRKKPKVPKKEDFNRDPEIRDKDWEAMLEQQRAENEAVRKEMRQPEQRVLKRLKENVKNALKPKVLRKKPKGNK